MSAFSNSIHKKRGKSIIEQYLKAINGPRQGPAPQRTPVPVRELDLEAARDSLLYASSMAVTQREVELCLRAQGVRVRMNDITGRMDIDGMPARYSNENAVNTLPVLMKDWLHDYGFKTTTGALCEYLMAIADRDSYNPVIDMLTGGAWDGQDRFGELHRVLGIEQGEFHSLLLMKWMCQCVELAFNGGKRPKGADGMLVLQGPQGCGKTRFFSVICAPAFGLFREGLSVDVDRVDSRIQATGCWIAELGELDSTLRREQAGLKAFITSATDVYRRPYAKADITRPRRTSFCATVNQEGFLRDETGNRRFWVIPVTKIDVAALNAMNQDWVVQLWRQVSSEVNSCIDFRLDESEAAQLRAQNRAYAREIPGEQEIRDLLDWGMIECNWAWFKPSEVRGRIMGYCAANASQIGKALRKLSQEDERIKVKRENGSPRFRLPLRRLD